MELKDLRYERAERDAVYGSLRNTIEGFNGSVKDGNGMALRDSARRAAAIELREPLASRVWSANCEGCVYDPSCRRGT